MARQLRLEFEGALYHLTARGNEQREIFLDDTDRMILGGPAAQHLDLSKTAAQNGCKSRL